MSAFGKKGGGGAKAGGRPAFGVARPMKTGGRADEGGEQFPPLPEDDEKTEAPAPEPSPTPTPSSGDPTDDAMSRLNERMTATHEAESDVGGFEASVHKIKEQVLPRL
ncbi:MAG: CpaF family protein, partial [Pseudomonadota bacterium]